MLPNAHGIHGFGGVRAAFFASVALAVATTAALWWLRLPTTLTGGAFLLISVAFLLPLWPLFGTLHPEHPAE